MSCSHNWAKTFSHKMNIYQVKYRRLQWTGHIAITGQECMHYMGGEASWKTMKETEWQHEDVS
jgi:hypothetical protein